jgi:hypothetical protein
MKKGPRKHGYAEDGKHTGNGERDESTLATWCRWMEVSMPGLKNAGREVA